MGAGGEGVVGSVDVFDAGSDAVVDEGLAPFLVGDGVPGAFVAGVALGLHGVAAKGAECCSVTGSHEYGICAVAEMVGSCVLSFLMGSDLGAWWNG